MSKKRSNEIEVGKWWKKEDRKWREDEEGRGEKTKWGRREEEEMKRRRERRREEEERKDRVRV